MIEHVIALARVLRGRASPWLTGTKGLCLPCRYLQRIGFRRAVWRRAGPCPISARQWPSGSGRIGARPLAIRAIHEVLQCRQVQYVDLPLLDLQYAIVLELREAAAHRLQLQAQVSADFLARHAQHQ
jgi:hypothetical protein